uniref:Possible cysteine desulfurase (Class-V aminotransferase family protein) n=1 Tax=Paulinella chromatophora TaxID=39717 RepID=B1X3T4_PAUCH|nr:possible cysteine desulfurase (class-V aminotransferase family protein) [Paulinella chromatophora]ACB42603.1 possible cysteine desulfurase (class-V aminotransferase family protein) [Paulinella chromatophora]
MIQLNQGFELSLKQMHRPLSELIYLDASATSPPAPEVLQVMSISYQKAWGNPSSLHSPGIKAAESLERSRQVIAKALGAVPNQVVFCSGGTESIHLALFGTAIFLPPGRLVISDVEHPIVNAVAHKLSQKGWTIQRWPVNSEGKVQLTYLDEILSPPTRLVSIVWGQGEVGTIQPVEKIGQACHERGIIFHTDAVQVLGHKTINWSKLPIDLLSFSAHKLHGPRGIGGFLRRSIIPCQPQFSGGGQESGLRSGTESVALAVGFASALDLMVNRLERNGEVDPLELWRNRLMAKLLLIQGIKLTGHPYLRLPYHISLLVKNSRGNPINGNRIVQILGNKGIAVSSGTACNSGTSRGSQVLQSMGYDEEDSLAGLRLTLGPWHAKDSFSELIQSIYNLTV